MQVEENKNRKTSVKGTGRFAKVFVLSSSVL